jgi:N-acetylglucosaminyl-diphospho-decaprenol L-rhamnosyltransferase
MSKILSIIIVNWNTRALLIKCVKSLEQSSVDNINICEVIVINNSNEEITIESTVLDITVVQNRQNMGFARACNQGAKIAKGSYLLFLNPDCVININSLLHPLKFLEKNETYAACGVQLRDTNGLISRSCTLLPTAYSFVINALGIQHLSRQSMDNFHLTDWAHDKDSDVDHIIGAFYFVRAKAFNNVGRFDERFLVYLEDLDLSLRLAANSWKIRYLASVNIMHVGGGASAKALAPRLYYSLSSRLRYSRKHHSFIGFSSVAIATLCMEPIIRLLSSIVTNNALRPYDIMRAYLWLWVDFAKTGAGAVSVKSR